jgi:trk system potassium uptake protein TrkH
MVLFRDAGHIIGVLLIILGASMLLTLPFSLYYADGKASSFLYSSLLCAIVGFAFRFLRRRSELRVNKRTGYLVVALGWMLMGIFSSLPYLFSGTFSHPVDALFESLSGFTTTGATVMTDIESHAPSILFWRSLTQWIGGLGIIVLSVAILPLLGIGGVELYVAEFTGSTAEKIHPRIQETAKRLWLIYLLLTGATAVLLYLAGMGAFDAINHSLTTIATGGFSTKNASVAHWQQPAIHYIIVFFMFLGGTNFTLLYFALKGRVLRVWGSNEFRAYFASLLVLVFLVFGIRLIREGILSELMFRESLFQVISIFTTTGYVTADYSGWGLTLSFIFFLLFFAGASAGSTSGGIKVIRHLVFLKNSWLEFKRILHPRGVVRIKIDQQIVEPRILTHIMVFLLVYMATFGLGTLVVAGSGMDLLSAAAATATCLGNVGPALGSVGPVDNFAHVPDFAKVFLSFLMLLGRLELFTILVLFTPFFWQAN